MLKLLDFFSGCGAALIKYSLLNDGRKAQALDSVLYLRLLPSPSGVQSIAIKTSVRLKLKTINLITFISIYICYFD